MNLNREQKVNSLVGVRLKLTVRAAAKFGQVSSPKVIKDPGISYTQGLLRPGKTARQLPRPPTYGSHEGAASVVDLTTGGALAEGDAYLSTRGNDQTEKKMIDPKYISGFFITLFTVLILILLCNFFFGFLGYSNDQLVSDMETKEVMFIIGGVAVFSGVSAGLSVFLVRIITKIFIGFK